MGPSPDYLVGASFGFAPPVEKSIIGAKGQAMKEFESCCVVETRDCTHPANYRRTSHPPCTCIPCGQKVCKKCSLVLYDKYLKRKVRVCLYCAEEDPKRFRFENAAAVYLYWQTCPSTWDSKVRNPYLLEMEV